MRLPRTAVLVGCDPSLELLSTHVAGHAPEVRVLWHPASSLAALGALTRGEAHAAAIREAGGRFIARGMPEEVYEAGRMTRTVLVEFPSVEVARAAHDSPAYQEALAALDGGAVRDLRIVPGVE